MALAEWNGAAVVGYSTNTLSTRGSRAERYASLYLSPYYQPPSFVFRRQEMLTCLLTVILPHPNCRVCLSIIRAGSSYDG